MLVQKLQMSLLLANAITGGLSKTTKMPCMSYGFPATTCSRGSELRKIEGSVCSKCYALRGHYTVPNIHDIYQRRYELTLLSHADRSDYEWVEAITYLIQANSLIFFRWFDSGDILGEWMLDNICDVAILTPNVMHWLPTKEKYILQSFFDSGKQLPDNLIVRLSADMIDGELPLEFVNRYEINLSGVSKKVFNCPSSLQNNQCGACRKCWNKEIKTVIYKYH